MERERSCCFSGHRPERLPWGEDEEDVRCLQIKERLRQAIQSAYEKGYRHFLCGVARGADTYFAEEVLQLREQHPDVTLECARPYEKQANSWTQEERERYESILSRCDYETVVQHHYTRGCMMRRNRYMVDHAAYIIVVYDGVLKGGTAYTLAYALRCKLETDILSLE